MICASCELEVGDDISVFHSPDGDLVDDLVEDLLGVIVVCQPCGQEIVHLLRARDMVLDPMTGEISNPRSK